MACALGVEQSCLECRMCRNRAPGKEIHENAGNETVSVRQSGSEQDQNIPGQISMDEYLRSLK